MAWYRKKMASQNALLNESRVLNSKCPKQFAGREVLKRRVVLPVRGIGSTRKRLS
jgi:hypothetical protein